MGRRRGWLSGLSIAGPAVICMLVLIVWIQSYFWADRLCWQFVSKHGVGDYETWAWQTEARSGGLRVDREHNIKVWIPADACVSFDSSRVDSNKYPYWISGPPDQRLCFGGFQCIIRRWKDAQSTRCDVSVVFPIAIAFLATSTLMYWVRHRLTCRSDQISTCRICGYDLRATRDRCPECGTFVLAKE
jgi:hypothetical protein